MATTGAHRRKHAAPLSIAVEGAIGVGKTTLARALAERLGAVRLLEGDIANPFLAQFYKNPARHALQCQLCFLEGRVRQFRGNVPVGVPVITDHSMIKEALFAEVNLDGDELALYRRIYAYLAPQVAFRPRVIVYMTASLEELRDRIRTRGRRMEHVIDVAYLKRLAQAYEAWFGSEQALHERVVVVSADGEGIAGDPAAIDHLVTACVEAVPGLQYCNPR